MSSEQPKLIVLDRDGVINRESKHFIKTPDEWQPISGSLEAIASLTQAGFVVVVATNQSGLGRGLFNNQALDEIHRKMTDSIRDAGGELFGIFVCPHRPDQSCACRKPKPGLMRQIEATFSCSLADQPMIGDSRRDLDAAKSVGAQAILVRTGNGAETEKSLDRTNDIAVFDDLASAARNLLERDA